MTWLWDRQKLPKSHFYVFYLGAKETTDMKSEENCMEIMTTQLSECFTQIPSKATVSISYKGLKLTQNIPMLSKHGNVKMRPVQLSVPAHCITFSMLGKAPFNDTLAVTMIVLNPELIKPLHTHVYRYDTCLTASLMHEKLQYLIHLPANQKALYNLEQRLYLPPVIKNKYETSTIPSRKDNCLTFREERSSNNLNGNFSKRSRHSIAVPSSLLPELSLEENRRFKLFGEAILRDERRKSMDNLRSPSAHINANPDICPQLLYKQNTGVRSFHTEKVRSQSRLFGRHRIPSALISSKYSS